MFFCTVKFQYQHAYCELQKRIYEHDAGPSMGFDRPEVTLQVRTFRHSFDTFLVLYHNQL